jgi:tripartite-type tricarboxylate transporter receptor subunit TctC
VLQGNTLTAQAQRADDYPSKPIRMIVPFAPGGPPDVIGRPVVQKLSEALGQPILFDNRPGAAGMIGTEVVAKSPRDGYTLLYTTGSHNTNPDVSQAAVRSTQGFRAGHADLAVLRAGHDRAPVTAGENGKGPSRAGARAARKAVFRIGRGRQRDPSHRGILHVRGEDRSDARALQGRGSRADRPPGRPHPDPVSEPVAGRPHIHSGRVRAIALAGTIRAPLFPAIPTFIEAGYPGVDMPGWQAMWFPAGTPRERIARIQQEVAKILRMPDIRKIFDDAGLRPIGSTPEEFTAFIEKDLAFFAKALRDARIDPQ